MKKIHKTIVVCCLGLSTSIFAYDMHGLSEDNDIKMGFFVRLAGSYNSVQFNQYLDASGISNVYSDSELVAFGQAGGPANPFRVTQSTFAPVIEFGYADRVAQDSDYFLGAKFSCRYLGLVYIQDDINVPQYGSFTNTQSAPSDTTFTGHVVIGSSQTTIDNQLSLTAFVGRTFDNNYSVYLGANSIVFSTKSTLYQATGFADINGTHVDITGTPDNFYDIFWIWGGGAEIGINYNISDAWMLNLNYSYAITGLATIANSAAFASESDGYTDTGTLYTSAQQKVISQGIAVGISMSF